MTDVERLPEEPERALSEWLLEDIGNRIRGEWVTYGVSEVHDLLRRAKEIEAELAECKAALRLLDKAEGGEG